MLKIIFLKKIPLIYRCRWIEVNWAKAWWAVFASWHWAVRAVADWAGARRTGAQGTRARKTVAHWAQGARTKSGIAHWTWAGSCVAHLARTRGTGAAVRSVITASNVAAWSGTARAVTARCVATWAIIARIVAARAVISWSVAARTVIAQSVVTRAVTAQSVARWTVTSRSVANWSEVSRTVTAGTVAVATVAERLVGAPSIVWISETVLNVWIQGYFVAPHYQKKSDPIPSQFGKNCSVFFCLRCCKMIKMFGPWCCKIPKLLECCASNVLQCIICGIPHFL